MRFLVPFHPERAGLMAGALLALLVHASAAQAQDRPKPTIIPQIAHTLPVKSVAISANGAYVLSGSEDKTVKLWDTDGRLLRSFQGHSDGVVSVALVSDGARVLSAGRDGTAKLWDAETGKVLHSFKGHSGSVQSVAFSPDGARVLSGGDDKTVKLWNATTGRLLHTFKGHSAAVRSVAFSPDGSRVLSAGEDKTVKVWNVATGRLANTFKGHSAGIGAVAFAPDGARVASGSLDKTVKLWDVRTGRLLRTFQGHADAVTAVAFTPDGADLLSASEDRTVRHWSVRTWELVGSFEVHTGWVSAAAFAPHGAHVVSGGGDNTVKLWDASSGQLLRTFKGQSAAIGTVAFAPDGIRVASGSDDQTVRLWGADKGNLSPAFKGHAAPVSSVAFAPDGKRIVSGSDDHTLKLWDVATGRLLQTLKGHSAAVMSVAFAPNGARVLSGSWDNTVRLWEAATGRLLHTFPGHAGWVHSVAFSPDGARVLSGGADNIIKLWDAATGELLHALSGHAGWVLSVAFSPDGAHLLSGSADNTVKLWDAATGQTLRAFQGHATGVSSVAFAPDGKRIASGSGDKTVKLWDARTGRLLRTIEAHSGSVLSLAFSPDGARLLSASTDGTVRIWDAASGLLLASLFASTDGEWLAMTSAGFFSGSRRGTESLSVVRGLEGFSAMQFYDHLYRPDLVEEVLKGDPESKHEEAARSTNLENILNSGPAPRIELLRERTERSGETIKLAARVIDQGGGIGPKVIWRVNGKTQGATGVPNLRGTSLIGDPVVIPQTLTVDPTIKNEVEIIAYNGEDRLATPPLRFAIDPWGVAIEARPRMFVLAVGVDKYAKKDWELSYAVKDATSFAAALKLVGSPLFGEPQVTTLRDTEVTEPGLAAEFDRLASIVNARDVFVLFLGGHGRSINGKWFYVPQDLDLTKGHTIPNNGIGPDKWLTWMAKIPAQKSLAVLDACEAGASEAFRGGDRVHETAMAHLEHSTGRNIIAAAPAGKAAYEGYRGHGLLTYAILESLHRGEGAAAETVDVFGLATHVSRQVPAISERSFGVRQHPRFTATGDNFPLGVRAAVLADVPDVIPSTPTHINPEQVDVFWEAGSGGGVVQQLLRYTPVRVLASERGWAHIARDGRALGYVPDDKLQRLAQ